MISFQSLKFTADGKKSAGKQSLSTESMLFAQSAVVDYRFAMKTGVMKPEYQVRPAGSATKFYAIQRVSAVVEHDAKENGKFRISSEIVL